MGGVVVVVVVGGQAVVRSLVLADFLASPWVSFLFGTIIALVAHALIWRINQIQTIIY